MVGDNNFSYGWSLTDGSAFEVRFVTVLASLLIKHTFKSSHVYIIERLLSLKYVVTLQFYVKKLVLNPFHPSSNSNNEFN